MNIQNRLTAFAKLGKFMRQFAHDKYRIDPNVDGNELFYDGMRHQLKLAHEANGWFTNDNLIFAFNSWSECLTEERLNDWLSSYNFSETGSKTIAVIMAGNIPLVGFHDFLSILISGHNIIVKLASQDKHLLPYLVQYLKHVEPGFNSKIAFSDGKLERFDAVIATGSNNTARYFDYYFRDVPALIRRNRNSVAVLSGDESEDQMAGLAEDIFRYFGLGCRSVSKLFIPKNYDFDKFFNAMYSWRSVINDQKYANNYDYNKAVYLMSNYDMLENGFLMLKEDSNYASPIATVFFDYYNSRQDIKDKLKADSNKIQCFVSDGFFVNEVAFGQTQKPKLNDYADGIDTVDFLLKI
ncbi:MAG: acyl-CoA reductase [Flavobacteriaceae bacterium]|nr:acyl-CoA reductase [Bacteroidia bacterium]MBT8287771.1 acyl-CoA reductase [Bacteroidia bacterium]NNF75409.1 acyl-CoA reductase [Flavobacteriaceae bacterium]NNK72243.1 acyl-CoA reductase [Flavobacteriaceae bacterium]